MNAGDTLGRVKIGYRTWTIVLVDREIMLEARRMFGATYGDTSRVEIAAIDAPVRGATLCHELKHAFDYTYLARHTNDAEACAHAVEHGMMDLLLNPENAWVLKYIKKWGRPPKEAV